MFRDGIDKVRCAGITYGTEERDAVMKIMSDLPSPWISMGKKTNEFERLVAKYVRVRYGIAVNSGSSANLLMLLALKELGYLKDGDGVITSPLTWATTIFPIIQLNLIPIFTDVDTHYNMDLKWMNYKRQVSKNAKCILATHMFGYPNNLNQIRKMAKKYNLIVLEDNCEALGAEYKGKRTGSFGLASTLSFFVAHHITTGEGGMILTNDFHVAKMCRSLRAFGRACTCPVCRVAINPNYYCKYRHSSGYDKRYVFERLGYSLKPTDISSAIGIEQIKKADIFLRRRIENAEYLTENLKKFSNYIHLPFEEKGYKNSWFVYPITIKKGAPFTRDAIVSYLEEHNIETRPLMAGNILDQPAMKGQKYATVNSLENVCRYAQNGFFIGTYQGITNKMREYQVKVISEFITQSL